MLTDIIDKYQRTYRILETSPNPKIQLSAIIDFFKLCEEENKPQLYKSFLPDFLNFIINIFKNSSVDFIDPQYLVISKFLLQKTASIESISGDEIIKTEINSIIEIINIKLIVLYYYLGEAENGLIILKDILDSKSVTESGVSLNHFADITRNGSSTSNALVDPNLFKINKVFDILRQIKYEIGRINSYSKNEINILLVESEENLNEEEQKSFGIVQNLECSFRKIKSHSPKNPFIENFIDIHVEGINEIRNALIKTSNYVLSKFSKYLDTVKTQINLKFRGLSGIYKGTSFGAGASLLIPASYLSYINSRTQYSISCSAAFTGLIDDNGNLQKLPDRSIAIKIESAFFSWIKYVVIPKENLKTAIDKLETLHKKYPRKDLNIIGVKNVNEIIGNNEIVKIEKEKFYLHTKKIVRKHPISSYSFLSILLILITTYAVWKIVPRNYKPYPQTTKDWISMIYSPDRDSVWKFTSISKCTGDTIFFGDIAIGDMLCHKIELWNNDDRKSPIRVELQGENKDEFEVLWGVDFEQKEVPEYIYNDIKQRLFIKFIPWKSLSEKRAELVFFSNDNPEKKKILYLYGNTGYFRNGYSFKIKNDDVFYINPKRGNILGHEFAISFWFKTNKAKNGLFCDNNSTCTLTKFAIRLEPDSILSLQILKPKSEQHNSYFIYSKEKVYPNQWNFIALSHKNGKTIFIVNDEVININTELDPFQQLEDMFIFGEGDPMQPDAAGFKTGWMVSYAEFRIYNKFLSEENIFLKKFQKENHFNDSLLVYYDFEETQGDKVFDKARSDMDSDLRGMPMKVLDFPLNTINDTSSIKNSVNDLYVKIRDKGEIRLNKDLFNKASNFTIQFNVKAGGNLNQPYRTFYHLSGIGYNYSFSYNADSISLERDDLFHGNIDFPSVHCKLDSLWHKYTLDYSLEKNVGRFFIDGNLKSEYSFGNYMYDITRQQFFILFGGIGQYQNPRFICEETSVDNITIFNRTLDENEVKQNDPKEIKKIPGLLALWTFNKIDGHVCFDEINRVPIFLWDDFQVLKK